MIVVDVGCANHEGENNDSVAELAAKYRPDLIYGFDPSSVLDVSRTEAEGCAVRLERKAAWIRDDHVCFFPYGVRGYVAEMGPGIVECFDLARFLKVLAPDEVILKIDAEGAEYTLLPHLVAHEADLLVKLMLVEWHEPHRREEAEKIRASLRCPNEDWWL